MLKLILLAACASASPLVRGVDHFCTVSNTFNNTCTVKAKSVRLTYDTVYETPYTMVFDNTIVQCVTTTGAPCSLTLALNRTTAGLILQNGSQLRGLQVIINATQSQVLISDSSSINVSGLSMATNGTQRNGGGAQYIGQGGDCNYQNYSSYGTHDSVPNWKRLQNFTGQLGSVGVINDAETAGGGRIVILADSIIFDGQGAALQANAMPFKTNSTSPYLEEGGSGGYIYVNTTNKKGANQIAANVTVEAQGGYGSNGGSGGIVVFENTVINATQVNAAGGQSTNKSQIASGCGDGAAGTFYWRNATSSSLTVSNNFALTVKQTILMTTPAVSSSVPSLANNVTIDGNSFVLIWTGTDQSYSMTNFTLGNGAEVQFMSGVQANTGYTVLIGENVQFGNKSHIDVSQLNIANFNTTTSYQVVNIGDLTYGRVLVFYYGNINVKGNIRLADANATQSATNSYLFFKETNSIHLYENATISAAYIQMHSNGPVITDSGSKITSLTPNLCNNLIAKAELFTCVPTHSMNSTITYASFLKAFNDRYSANLTSLQSALYTLSQNYSVYIVSFKKVEMNKTVVTGPRIGVCSPIITMVASNLTAAEKGCTAQQGLGGGQYNSSCPGSGGAHGGQGGYGSAGTPCMKLAPMPYFYSGMAMYEGSGGGRGNSSKGGAGGGIIWLSATNKILLNNSTLDVQGQDGFAGLNGRLGSGGGAGGSIQIITKEIAGKNAVLDLSGGDGSAGGGGGGSGGRFAQFFTQSFNASNLNQSVNWNGTIVLDGGKGGSLFAPISNLLMATIVGGGDGQPGTTTQTQCFGGFSGPFCKPCEVGTFKFNFGSGICQPCTNKPANSFYTNISQATDQCLYECNKGFESVSVNPSCLSSLDLQVERVGGVVGTLSAAGCFFILVLVLWITIIARSKCIKMNTNDQHDNVFNEILTGQSSEDQVLGETNLNLKDIDILNHSYRMYLIGENSISFPWYMPKDFPIDCLDEIPKDRLLQFIKREQWTMDWSACQRQLYYIFRLFFPYMADYMHRAIRRKHFTALQSKLFDQFEPSFWEEQKGKHLRVSCDKDCQLSYIDFLDTKRSLSYQGPQLPITLLLAGNGTLQTPYNLNFTNDPLAKSLVLLNQAKLQKKLPPFFENLNSLLDKLCFYKFNRQTIKDLSDIVEWVELGNKTLFQPLDVKMTLYLFENSYQEVEGGSFKQRRRSLPLEFRVFDSFPDMFKRLIQFVQLKLINKKSEIRFGLVFKSNSQSQSKRMNSRIQKIVQAMASKENVTNIMNSLYNSDEEDTTISQAQSFKSTKGGYKLNRQGEMSDTLLSVEESSVNIGGKEGVVRLQDKSKRAYDTSVESTRALELAIQKDNRKCANACTRFKSVWYSLWILTFKAQGVPPATFLNFWFLMYSVTFALEILLTFVFLIHIAVPTSNVWGFGFPFLFILPGLTILAPLWGGLAILCGSAQMMKSYSNMNATMLILNYPLTLLYCWFSGEPIVYTTVLLFLILNKVALSAFGCKVRQNFCNPQFQKNQMNIRETLADMITQSANKEITTMSPASRAAQLVASGKPRVKDQAVKIAVDSSDEDDSSFGITSTKQLK